MSATKQTIDYVEKQKRERPMICVNCGNHWLDHSYHGSWCPVGRHETRTTYVEYTGNEVAN